MNNEPTTTTTNGNGQERKALAFTVSAMCEGFPVSVVLEVPPDKLSKALRLLQRHGIEAPAARPGEWQWTPGGEGVEPRPICPKHNAVMVKHSKQGDAWYAHRVTAPDGSERWCRGCRNPSDKADGWLVD